MANLPKENKRIRMNDVISDVNKILRDEQFTEALYFITLEAVVRMNLVQLKQLDILMKQKVVPPTGLKTKNTLS